MGKC